MGDIEGIAMWEAEVNKSLGRLKSKQVHRLGRPKRAYPRSCLTIRGRDYQARDYNL